MRPIAARAMIAIERTRDSQVTPEIARHSPRNGFNGFLRALPGDRAFLPPSPAASSRELDASVGASGPHDFAVRFGAIRQERQSIHRIPHPTSVTIAIRPSCEAGCAKDAGDLGYDGSNLFFGAGLDDPNQIESSQQIPV